MAYSAKTYVGGATAATLVADISSSVTSFTINIPSTYTTPWTTLAANVATAPAVLVLDYGQSSEEKVLISGLSIVGGVGTVTVTTRGYDGTSAQNHYAASAYSILPVAAAVDFQEANAAVVNTIGKITSAGDLLYGAGANATSRLAIGAQGGILTSTGSAPSWLATGAAGTILQGGTTPSWLAAGTSGYHLTSTGSGVAWASQAPAHAQFDNSAAGSGQAVNNVNGTEQRTTLTMASTYTMGSSYPTISSNVVTPQKSGLYKITLRTGVQNTSNSAAIQAALITPSLNGSTTVVNFGSTVLTNALANSVSVCEVVIPIDTTWTNKTITPQVSITTASSLSFTVPTSAGRNVLSVTYLGPLT